MKVLLMFIVFACGACFGKDSMQSKQDFIESKSTDSAQEMDYEIDYATKIADIFYALNYDPKNPKQKINHTQGFCALGTFTPNSEASKRFDIPILRDKNIPAEVRYSLGGAIKSDKSKGRGMALRMQTNAESWSMVLLNTEINFAKNPQEFITFFEMRIPQNGRVDSEKIKTITQNTPSFKNFEKYMQGIGITPSVANTAYHSIHTFYFKEKNGKNIPARITFEPLLGAKYATQKELDSMNDSFLESDFARHVANAPIKYNMYLILANKGDRVDDTTALWQGAHKRALIGTLSVAQTSDGACNDEMFLPADIPQGVSAPSDPLFSVRNEVYGITFGRRQ